MKDEYEFLFQMARKECQQRDVQTLLNYLRKKGYDLPTYLNKIIYEKLASKELAERITVKNYKRKIKLELS